jgi:hypothetical protein
VDLPWLNPFESPFAGEVGIPYTLVLAGRDFYAMNFVVSASQAAENCSG